MGNKAIIKPEATTNLVTNPSFETNTTGYLAGASATFARVNSDARRGLWSLLVSPNSVDNGAAVYSLPLAAATTYTFSVDAKFYTAYRIGATDNANNFIASVSGTPAAPGTWQRYTVTFTTTTSATYKLWVQATTATSVQFTTDGWQLEQKAYATTFTDGDNHGSWNGTPHASTSTRKGTDRRGGQLIDLEDYGAILLEEQGTGMGPLTHRSTRNTYLGGEYYQGSTRDARVFTLSLFVNGLSPSDLRAKRAALIDLIKPDLVPGQQPFWLVDTDSDRKIPCVYDTGLDRAGTRPWTEDVDLRLIAHQPVWYQAEGQTSKSLSVNETFADADYIVERQANGVYHALGGGLNGVVYAAVYGPDGALYVGGAFTIAYNAAGTGSPVTVNRIAKWTPDPSLTAGGSWTALGSGFNNTVYALIFDAASNLYAGGAFTDASYQRLARWNGSAWSAVGSATAGTGDVNSLTIGTNGLLYIGGAFTNWNGVSGNNYFLAWNGAAYSLPGGAAPTNVINVVKAHPWGDVLVGGDFSSIGGTGYNRLARYTPSTNTWAALPGATFNFSIYAIEVMPDGTWYVGGVFTAPTPNITHWQGSAFVALGSGVNGFVYALWQKDGMLGIGGAFTQAGNLAIRDRFVGWNGSAYFTTGLDLPGTATVYATTFAADGRAAIGFDTAGTATASNLSDTIVTNPGTAPAAPIIRITGPGTLESIVNTTTGKALYFNLTLQAGETAYLNLTQTGMLSFTSSYRGNILSTILPTSNVASWRLLPGDNVVLVKMSGTTGASAIGLHWLASYESDDV